MRRRYRYWDWYWTLSDLAAAWIAPGRYDADDDVVYVRDLTTRSSTAIVSEQDHGFWQVEAYGPRVYVLEAVGALFDVDPPQPAQSVSLRWLELGSATPWAEVALPSEARWFALSEHFVAIAHGVWFPFDYQRQREIRLLEPESGASADLLLESAVDRYPGPRRGAFRIAANRLLVTWQSDSSTGERPQAFVLDLEQLGLVTATGEVVADASVILDVDGLVP